MHYQAKGHISYKGKLYVKASAAAHIMGVSRTTIKRWYVKGMIKGISMGSRKSSSGRLYILKSCLSKSLLEYSCMICGKTVKSRTYRDPDKRHFCSKKCCDKWWNVYRPVGSDRKRTAETMQAKKNSNNRYSRRS